MKIELRLIRIVFELLQLLDPEWIKLGLQINQFDIIIEKCMDGSITIEEAILQLRGGDGLTDLVGVITFVIVRNWLNSLLGMDSFQANPLSDMDPIGWVQGS
jgi:hypothetical protein